MRIALDPHMHRHLSLEELPRKVAELGYEWIELSPRDDFLAWWVNPRAYPERIASFKKSLKDHGVKIASLLPMYRWASPHEDERQSAVKYWKKAIEIAVEMGVDTMNSEFGPQGELLRRHVFGRIKRGRVVALYRGTGSHVRTRGRPA
jgi:myo-inositol catabolism protein IolH